MTFSSSPHQRRWRLKLSTSLSPRVIGCTSSNIIKSITFPSLSLHQHILVSVRWPFSNSEVIFTNQNLRLNLRESIRGRGAVVTQSANTVEVKNLKPIVFNHGYSTTEELGNFEAAASVPISVGVFFCKRNYTAFNSLFSKVPPLRMTLLKTILHVECSTTKRSVYDYQYRVLINYRIPQLCSKAWNETPLYMEHPP